MESLILASASPYRRMILENLGLKFSVVTSQVDEESHPESDPVERAQALAIAKAKDVSAWHPESWIIGCDTLVVASDGTLLEKPRDAEDARSMLARQSGGVSVVHSGLCLISPKGDCRHGISSSSVHFKKLDARDIDTWIQSGLWEGRSGGFQMDGKGQLLVRHLEGDWTSVVGLPVFLLGELAEQAGFDLWSQR